MKITIKDLIEKDVCDEGVEWFKEHFDGEVDIWDVIKLLEEQKDSNGYIGWLFREFKLTGVCKEWHYDGKLWRRANYKDGELHGEFEWWDDDGQLRDRCNYKDGEYHGKCEWWDKDGVLTDSGIYDNGTLVKEAKYENNS
jgi:antitoxin component YwqK of YwqJK toxin-antitoxin module